MKIEKITRPLFKDCEEMKELMKVREELFFIFTLMRELEEVLHTFVVRKGFNFYLLKHRSGNVIRNVNEDDFLWWTTDELDMFRSGVMFSVDDKKWITAFKEEFAGKKVVITLQ